jgi:hypothetical protein
MKVSVRLAMTLAALVGSASAAPLCTSIGSTMDAYVAQGSIGCTVGDKLFSNFIYGSSSRGNGVSVPSTAVTVTPVNAGTFDPGPGLVFSANWSVPSVAAVNSFVDSSIAFDVTVMNPNGTTPGPPIIEDGYLKLTGFAVSGTGIVDITETISPAGIQLQVDGTGPFVSHKFFAPVSTVHVLKDLLVSVPGGTAPGSASITSFEEDFSESPEPVGTILVGSGLLALGVWRRRR